MKFRLEFKAELEGLKELVLDSNCYYHFEGHCSNCQESLEVFCSLDETHPIPGSRGEAHAVMKCKLCERSLHLNILKQSSEPYSAEHSGQFREICTFEGRGIELDKWIMAKDEFSGNAAESDHTFKDITFGEGEWYDYDEEGECSVSVTEIEHRLEHFK